LKGQAKRAHVHSLPQECTDEGDDEDLSLSNNDMFALGTVFISIFAITVSLCSFLGKEIWVHCFKSHLKKSEQQRLFEAPPTWQRLCGQSESEKRLDFLTQLEDTGDIKIVAGMFEARHATVLRTQDYVKPDPQLTIADVPMLIELIKTAVAGARAEPTREGEPAAASDGAESLHEHDSGCKTVAEEVTEFMEHKTGRGWASLKRAHAVARSFNFTRTSAGGGGVGEGNEGPEQPTVGAADLEAPIVATATPNTPPPTQAATITTMVEDTPLVLDELPPLPPVPEIAG
jgi:hypothetical protein